MNTELFYLALVAAFTGLLWIPYILDRVAVLLDGEIVETGPPERIFERPNDPRVRRFVNGELLYDETSTEGSPDGDGRLAPDPPGRGGS